MGNNVAKTLDVKKQGALLISSLFTDDDRLVYEMPCYQRSYSWDWKQNCEVLLKDIETLGQADKGATIDDHLEDISYYIGQIILDPVYKSKKMAPRCFRVTDGQQRLTTIFLMLRALSQQPHLSNDEKEWIADIIYVGGEGKELSLILKNRDSIAFEQIMSGEISKKTKNTLLYKNYCKFYEYFNNLTANQLKNFCDNLNCLEITTKFIQSYEDPQLVFAKINSTTKGLNDFDLIRNYLLDEKDENISRLCQKFDEIENLLAGKDAWPGNFIKYYTEIKLGKCIPTGNYRVYKAFISEFAKGENLRISNILDEMLEYAKIFNMLINNRYNKDGIDSEFLLNTMGLGAVMPLIMRLIRATDHDEISSKSVRSIMMNLTSFYIRSFAVGNHSFGNTHEQFICEVYKRMTEEAVAHNTAVEDEFLKFMKSNLNDVYRLRMPTDEEVRNSLLGNSKFYNKNTISKIRYILNGIENSYNNGETTVKSDLQIDHIMPQNLTEVDKKKHGITDEMLEKYLHHIGNLTLMTSKANGDKGNKLSKDYYENSSLSINKYPSLHADEWSEKHIMKRAEDMVERFLQVWKYPY